MSGPTAQPPPGPAGSADEPRASAVLIGIVAVLLGVVAIVAIVSGGGGNGGAVGPSHLDDEERAIERAAAARAGLLPGEGHVGVRRRATDAGVARSPEAGIGPSVAPPAEPSAPAAAPTVSSRPALVPGERPAGVNGEITEAQEYEATAFFLDLLILRRDTLRRDLETARRVGDGPRIRRLEPDEATLDAEIARFVERSRELERRGREREVEDEPSPLEPDPAEPSVAPL